MIDIDKIVKMDELLSPVDRAHLEINQIAASRIGVRKARLGEVLGRRVTTIELFIVEDSYLRKHQEAMDAYWLQYDFWKSWRIRWKRGTKRIVFR